MLKNLRSQWKNNSSNQEKKNQKEPKQEIGLIDQITDNLVSGWCYDKSNPEKKHLIHIYADDLLIATGMANLFRSDLLNAGMGEGFNGFKIELPFNLDIKDKQVKLSAKTSDGIYLHGTFDYTHNPPKTLINKEKSKVSEGQTALNIHFEEYGIRDNKIVIRGWAFGNKEIEDIDIYFLDKKIASIGSKLERSDVKQAFKNEKHSLKSGFHFEKSLTDFTNNLNFKLNFEDEHYKMFNFEDVQKNDIEHLLLQSQERRKRGKDERTKVLFISPHLPDYDTSSGGKRATRMLALIAEEADVYCFTLGEKQPKFVDKLAEYNVKTIDAPYLWDIDINTYDYHELTSEVEHFDVIIYAWYDMWYLNQRIKNLYPNARLIFDSVDVHWVRHQRLIGIDPEMTKERFEISKQSEIDAYKQADIIWAVTEEDKQAILKEIPFANVKVVSNIHDPDILEYKDAGTNNILFFGGFKHTPNLSAAKILAEEIMPIVLKEIPDAKLILAGSHAPDDIKALGELPGVDFRGFIEEEDLEKLYIDSYATVIPLLAGAGIKGKICEAICYMTPIITNDIGNEGIRLEHEKSGLVTNDIEEMANLTIKALKRKYDMESFTKIAQEKLSGLVGSSNVKKQMMDSIHKEVSICVVTWNRLKLVKRCIESILEKTYYSHYKILVYSNGCTDGTQEYLKEIAKENDKIVPMLSDENEVFVIPNNKMMMKFPENDVVLLNNDTYVTEGWLRALVESAYAGNHIGLTGSKILYPNGRLQEYGSYLHANYGGVNVGKNDDPNKPEYQHMKHVGYVSGCSLFIKRSTINRIGVFDEKFHPCYCEDSDLCYTAAEHGLQTFVVPNSVIYHDEGGTSGTDTSSGFKAYQNINFLKFYQKHQGKLNGIDWGLQHINADSIRRSFQSKYRDKTGQKILNGTQLKDSVSPIREFNVIKSKRAFNLYREQMVPVYQKRHLIEELIVRHRSSTFSIPGYSPVIDEVVAFRINNERTENRNGIPLPNYRESLVSSKTQFNSRLRATAMLINQYTDGIDNDDTHIYFTESNSAFSKFYKEKYKNFEESEYIDEYAEAGKMIAGIYHQNLIDLSFDDNSFDIIVSLDKLQFYQDYQLVLEELYRCLKPGGKLILSAPFGLNAEFNKQFAEKDKLGAIKFLDQAIYYPNPVKGKDPLLCYYHFGWELFNEMESAGFKNVSANFMWSLYYGILGTDVMLISAEK